jgi:hypothetical protein
VQEGGPIPPPTITVVDGPARRGMPTKLKVEWLGGWTSFNIYCGTVQESYAITYYRRNEPATCIFEFEGTYYVNVGIFYLENYKTSAYTEVRVMAPYPIFAPLVSS